MSYLTPELNHNIRKKYSYQTKSDSINTKLLGWFYDYVASILPDWLAPNLITMIGGTSIFINLVIFLLTHNNFQNSTGSPLSFVYIFCGLCFYFYDICDIVDGKQARRTGSSSPLGELFDHGIDSFIGGFFALICCCAFQLGRSVTVFFVITIGYISFYDLIANSIVTGYLYFDFIGNEEVIILIMILFFIIGKFGAKELMVDTTVFGNPLGKCIAVFFVVLFVALYTLKLRKMMERKKEFWIYVRCMIPFFLPFVCYLASMLVNRDFYYENVTPFNISYDLFLTYTSERIVFDKIVSVKPKGYYPFLLLCPIVLMMGVLGSSLMLYCVLAVQILFLVHFNYYAFTEVRDCLGVNFFTIEKKKE